MRKQFVAGLVLLFFVVTPFEQAIPQATVPRGVEQPGSAVLHETTSELVNLYNRSQSNVATAGDYQSAATALRILFAEWEENGTNKLLQNRLNDTATSIGRDATEDDVANFYAQLQQAGAAVTKDQVRRLLYTHSASERRDFAANYAHQGGVESIEAHVVETLLIRSSKVSYTEKAKDAGISPIWICEVAGLIGLYSAVIAIACIPCAIIAGPVGLVSTIVAFIAC